MALEDRGKVGSSHITYGSFALTCPNWSGRRTMDPSLRSSQNFFEAVECGFGREADSSTAIKSVTHVSDDHK